MDMDPVTVFKDLPPSCMVNIFSRLAPHECAAATCVCQLWSQVAGEDSLWRPHLAADYATSNCTGYDGAAAASFKSAYSSWRSHFADVHGPLLARALAAWSKVTAWLGQHSPRILQSLNPGATAAEVAAAEAALGHPLPSAMRVIYRVHNGQALALEQQSCEEGPPADLLMGLFGTTAFYDHVTSTQLVPLDKLVRVTRLLRSMRPLGAGQTMLTQSEVVYGHSFRMSDKLCVVDCSTGAVALKLANRDWPIAPPQDTYPGACDGILRWFEEYASRLSAGMYCTCAGEAALADAGLNEGQAISLFPQTYPHAATAITRGVKVTWSSVLVPQESRQGRLMFAYKVAFSLLTPPQQQDTLTQLAAQQRAWQQRLSQQQQQPGAASPAAAVVDAAPAGPANEQQQQQQQQQGGSGAGSAPEAAAAVGSSGVEGTSGSVNKPFRQTVVCGSCDASAGPAAVPPALAKLVPWIDAAAAADGGSSAGGSSAAAAAGVASASEPGVADGLSSCQLESRHWLILNGQGSEIDRVEGEGVVGLYPLLCPGKSPFGYASCTPCPIPEVARDASAAGAAAAAAARSDPAASGQQQQLGGEEVGRWQSGPGRLAGSVAGCMEGAFSFVGGSLMQRSGGSFEVACPRLVFAVPEYIF